MPRPVWERCKITGGVKPQEECNNPMKWNKWKVTVDKRAYLFVSIVILFLKLIKLSSFKRWRKSFCGMDIFTFPAACEACCHIDTCIIEHYNKKMYIYIYNDEIHLLQKTTSYTFKPYSTQEYLSCAYGCYVMLCLMRSMGESWQSAGLTKSSRATRSQVRTPSFHHIFPV